MSDAHVVEHAAIASSEPFFTNAEMREFVKDDVTAGGNIGKMLSILFIYTLFAMTFVGYWTFNSVSEEVSNRRPMHAEPEAHEPPAAEKVVEGAK